MNFGLEGASPFVPTSTTYSASFSRRFNPLLGNSPLSINTEAMESGSPNKVDESPKQHRASVGDSECVIQYEDCTGAAYRIRKGISRTPLVHSPQLSSMIGMNLFFKREFTLPTGSFKERGARNSLSLLSQDQKVRGVIAASAGNHALALAYHGKMMDIPVTVVMPMTAPIVKISRCEMYGATVVLHGEDLGEAKKFAMSKAKEDNIQYINGYNDPHILAGQGTVALEVIEQLEAMSKTMDAIVVPVGGGGLIAGISVVIKHLSPEVEVIGVESEQCPSFTKSLEAGHPVYVKPKPTLADGLAVPRVGPAAFATAKDNVDSTVLVSEDDIALAILRLVEVEKAVVEGAGATGLAACLSGKLDRLAKKNVVVILCGGNIDTTVLGRCIERGLAADGRLVRLKVVVNDRPGGLKSLVEFLYEQGVSVKDIVHERTWLKGSIFNVEIDCVVETRGAEHAMKLKQETIKKYGKDLVRWGHSIPEDKSDDNIRLSLTSSFNSLSSQ